MLIQDYPIATQLHDAWFFSIYLTLRDTKRFRPGYISTMNDL